MTDLNFDLLDDKSVMETIETVAKLADENDIDWALAGGLAVILYGSDRLTKDIDFIASKKLPLESKGSLVQGGERYSVKTSNKEVTVDWITRDDEARKFYERALKDAVMIRETPVLSPEWLVILKYIAGRFKDQEDGVFLLKQKDLVDRNKVKQMILEIGGNETWAAFRSGLERWYELADGGKPALKEGYIDS